MADSSEACEENVPGAWYVDKSCIFCGLCNSIAPDNFAESEDGTHDYVYKQPDNDEELAACQDAMAQCPVNSIGNDRE
jgi:ferredoxin